MAALKCPNPACPFRFDPKSVPPGATLACPRCQTRFSLGASGGVATEARPLPAKTPARRPSQATLGKPVGVVVAAVVVLALVGAVTAITLVGRQQRAVQVGGPVDLVAVDQNFALTTPPGWVADQAAQNSLGVNVICYRHPGGKAWVALGVRDYETRAPFELELKNAVIAALEKAFIGVARKLTYAPAPLGGQAAEKAPFRGETRAGSLACIGEVTILSHKGIGYWLYAWAVETDAAEVGDDLDRFRASFRLLGSREDWTPKATPETLFRGVSEPSVFALSTTNPEWTQTDGLDPKGQTPPAELLLTGRIRSKGDRSATATAAVFVVDPVGEPQAQAEKLIRARHTPDPELFGPTAIVAAEGDIQGVPASPADVLPTLSVTRLTAKATEAGTSTSSDKLVVFTVASLSGKTVIAEATCPLSERAIWERRLVQLVGSLGPNR